MKKILFITVVVQLLTISFLTLNIFRKSKNILGSQSINPIDKRDISLNSDSNLSYFYEPAPNSTQRINPWLPIALDYKINLDGLNEEKEYTVEKPKDTFRIITLGDSFTFGLYVPTKDNYSKKFESLLNKNCVKKRYEVINLGVYGYDILYSLERFRIRGIKYDPDLIIWQLENHNFIQNNELILRKEKYYFQQMKKSGEFERRIKNGENYPSWNEASNDILATFGQDYLIQYNKKLIPKINDYFKKTLVFTTFPDTKKEFQSFLQNFVRSRKNTYFFNQITDLNNNQDLFLPGDGHPSKKGHEQIARNVFNYLTKNKLIPCN